MLLDLERGAKTHKFEFYKKIDFVFEISSNLGSKNDESKLFFGVFQAKITRNFEIKSIFFYKRQICAFLLFLLNIKAF